jgi:hypothetical protein
MTLLFRLFYIHCQCLTIEHNRQTEAVNFIHGMLLLRKVKGKQWTKIVYFCLNIT